jgi:serine protease Do
MEMSTRSRNWLKFGALVALAFVLGLFFAGLLDFPRAGFAQERAAHTPIVTVSAPSIPAARPLIELSDAYAAIAEAVRPSVVYIESDRPVTDDQSQVIGQLPPQFRQLMPQQQQRQAQPQEPEIEHSSGSGFIVSSDGYILTNNHVIEGSSKVTVRLLDGRQFTAKIVGTDKDTDIGVLKIDATGLTPAALGSSDATKVGEWVLAIGNPLGQDLTFTVTQGIVSAKGRGQLNFGDNDGGRVIQDYIQTDAVINRGNSGGPLVNARGEVIGINAAIASATGYYTGYAFAVPIDMARKVMDQIITSGHVVRAGLGVMVHDASREDAQYLGLPKIAGVLVESFAPHSTAEAAGIQPGDVITAIDGQPVSYTAQLQQIVGFRRPGDEVKVTVARKDGTHTYSVRLTTVAADDSDSTGVATVGGARTESNSASALLGITTEPLTAAMAQQYGLPAGTHGLVIDHVVDGSPASGKVACPAEDADQCGPPDVIVKVEGKSIASDADLKAAVAGAQHGIVTLQIMNGDRSHVGTSRIERIRLH